METVQYLLILIIVDPCFFNFVSEAILNFVFTIAVVRSLDVQVVCLSCVVFVFVLVLNKIVVKYTGCFVVSLPVHVLDWFQSYLTGRTQTVQIKKSTSEPHELKYGVPVLGPILFTIYTTPLGQLIRRHGLTFHLYADDTQLYSAFKPSEPSSIVNNISRLEKCIDDIQAWMKLNLLKLNDNKTEILVQTSRPSTSQSLHISIKVGDQDISPSEEPPKNLGVIFYPTCSLRDHVSNV